MLQTRRLHFAYPDTFVLQQAFYSERVIPPLHKSSNNLLAVEPETENDIARRLFLPAHHDFLRLKRRLFATTTRIYSNDQHVDTCGDAWCRDDGRNFRWRCTCVLAGADPGAA